MRVATTFDVVAAREALAEAGLACELHLHDACGAQSMELRPTGEGAAEEAGDLLAQAAELVTKTLASRGLAVESVDKDGCILRVV